MLISPQAQSLELRSKLFRGFSDASRLAILEVLREGPRAVNQIVQTTGLSQPNVSNHLGCLRDCGLVISEQRGRYSYYRLSDPRVEELLSLADQLLADTARGIYECTRYQAEEPRDD